MHLTRASQKPCEVSKAGIILPSPLILHVGKLRLRVFIFCPKSLKNEVAKLRYKSAVLMPNIVWLRDPGGL